MEIDERSWIGGDTVGVLMYQWSLIIGPSPCLQTIADVDQDNDGKISKEDWKAFVIRNPSLLKNMTLPYLKYVCNFPCFILLFCGHSPFPTSIIIERS